MQPAVATLFSIIVGKTDALPGDTVNVGRSVLHQSIRVAAKVGHADVVTRDDQDVRIISLRHMFPPYSSL